MQISEYDAYLFHEGTNYEIYQKMGAHPCSENGREGTRFIVWAPNAKSVSVITEKNNWDPFRDVMSRSKDGIFELFIPGVGQGDLYRLVVTGQDGIVRYKSDPYAFASELRPKNASIVWGLDNYRWTDQRYMAAMDAKKVPLKPMAIYEVYLGSWKKDYRKGPDGFLNYRELADELAEYVNYMGFTHVELIGICEHPFDGSWGYQVTGYYAPTSRYGTPDDFRYFVDKLHNAGIGVILDWVPAHFPKDSFGLEHFDGSCLYESEDPLLAEYPEWGTMAFDHSKPEVRNYLIANALYWLREFHIDALRVDAVAAILYTSFSRTKWRPNKYGGSENIEGIGFLKQFNQMVARLTKGYTIAEDSSILPGVTKSVDEDGLGFMFKWNMGWMNDTLKYFEKDPIFRGYHHSQLTHTTDYAFLERFILVLSHDEVVHLKKSLVEKMPGAQQDKIGGLKSLYTFQIMHPGKKLIFMGQEFAEEREWAEDRIIDWGLSQEPWHRDVMDCVRKLLKLYRTYPCLYEEAQDPKTLEWINRYDSIRSTISFMRRNPWDYHQALIVVCNFSPVPYDDYTFGVPVSCTCKEVFSTYDTLPDSGAETHVSVKTEERRCDSHPYTVHYSLKPYESVVFEMIPD